jgi:hypothetical protein
MKIEECRIGQIVSRVTYEFCYPRVKIEREGIIVDIISNFVYVEVKEGKIEAFPEELVLLEDVKFQEGDIVRRNLSSCCGLKEGDITVVLGNVDWGTKSFVHVNTGTDPKAHNPKYLDLIYRKGIIDFLPKGNIEAGDTVMVLNSLYKLEVNDLVVVESVNNLRNSLKIIGFNGLSMFCGTLNNRNFLLVKKGKKEEKKNDLFIYGWGCDIGTGSDSSVIFEKINPFTNDILRIEGYFNKDRKFKKDDIVQFTTTGDITRIVDVLSSGNVVVIDFQNKKWICVPVILKIVTDSKFKIGDVVERINSKTYGMNIGDISIIEGIRGGSIDCKGSPGNDEKNLRLVYRYASVKKEEKEPEFKVGDVVKRFQCGEFQGMKVGDMDIIKGISGNCMVLMNYPGLHSMINYHLAARPINVINYELDEIDLFSMDKLIESEFISKYRSMFEPNIVDELNNKVINLLKSDKFLVTEISYGKSNEVVNHVIQPQRITVNILNSGEPIK